MDDSILAWHFSDGKLRFDYTGVKVEAGLVLETTEKPVIGRKGFHASIKAVDALNWFSISPSDEILVSRVRLSGDIVIDNSKSYGERLVAQKREHLWVADANDTIETYAMMAYRWILRKARNAGVPIDNQLETILSLRRQWRSNLLSNLEKQKATSIIASIEERTKEVVASLQTCYEGFYEQNWDIWPARDFVASVPRYIITGLQQENNVFVANITQLLPQLGWLEKRYNRSTERMRREIIINKALHRALMQLAPERYEE
jgi:hypothetical protein